MATYGLIGYPLTHSLSKKYFNDRFTREGLPHTFLNFPIERISDLPGIISNVSGLAVTIPYKESVIPYLDDLSVEAKAIGAVNCITIENGKTCGYNTDAAGFEKSIHPFLNKNNSALVFGTGGASKAVCYVLEKNGIAFARTGRIKKEGVLNYEELTPAIIHENLLLINTTPLGMYPGIESKPPIPYETISSRHILYDLVYNPEITAFLNEGQIRGAQIKNGLEMLFNQAEENWRLWFGR